jgi:hypothetical protein
MQHDSRAEGNATLTSNALSDFVEIRAATGSMGQPLAHRMRVMSDAEALVWYHHVGERPSVAVWVQAAVQKELNCPYMNQSLSQTATQVRATTQTTTCASSCRRRRRYACECPSLPPLRRGVKLGWKAC